ncbi:MAG: DUF2254 domain-containing protein [Pseudomonadota bacterium]
MLSQYLVTLRRISRILWVRVALILGLSILAALLAPLLDPIIPLASKDRFSAEATLPILNILANSMLAVTTFSLGVMVSTHRGTAEQTTPRIHRLLMDDTRTQTVLATFIGAFVFALSSIILYRADYYSDSASVAVFFATVLVVAIVVGSIVRWIDHLSDLGSMDHALAQSETAARETLKTLADWPALGAHMIGRGDVRPDGATPVQAQRSGYVEQIDMEELNSLAEAHGVQVYIHVLPGDAVLTSQTLAYLDTEAPQDAFSACFSLTEYRAHEQDARYAIQTLRETASKALSAGINDPGTAIEVINRLERVLWDYLRREPPEDPVCFDRLHMSRLEPKTLIDTAFRDIARDGAANVGVLIGVHGAVSTLAEALPEDQKDSVRHLLSEIADYAEMGLRIDAERDAFKAETQR